MRDKEGLISVTTLKLEKYLTSSWIRDGNIFRVFFIRPTHNLKLIYTINWGFVTLIEFQLYPVISACFLLVP